MNSTDGSLDAPLRDILVCNDIDECDTAYNRNLVCQGEGQACINFNGGFHCTCQVGFSKMDAQTALEAQTSCFDLNECELETHSCDYSATCTNTPGSFHCKCLNGYEGDGIICDDVDECRSLLHDCDNFGEVCTNTIGWVPRANLFKCGDLHILLIGSFYDRII